MASALTTIEIAPRTAHQYSIIWLHGLGADGHDFEGIVPELKLPQQASIHFIFPNAPVQAVTINGGMRMRAWYDILEANLQSRADIAGIVQSAAQVALLIDHEIAAGIAPERIILAGFSQGGVIALHTGLRYPRRLGGIIALSTYLPTVDTLDQEAAPANQHIPIFMAHGTVDPIVSIQAAQVALAGLQARGYFVQWQEYAMQHSVCPAEIKHIAAFIDQSFSKTATPG